MPSSMHEGGTNPSEKRGALKDISSRSGAIPGEDEAIVWFRVWSDR